jgi:hypothetical protein
MNFVQGVVDAPATSCELFSEAMMHFVQGTQPFFFPLNMLYMMMQGLLSL